MELTEVRRLLARGRYMTALKAGAEVGGDESRSAADRARGYLLGSQAANLLELYREAAALARRSLALAGGETLLGEARVAVGVAALRLGDPYEAEEHLLSALSLLLPDEVRGGAQYNLGRTYEQLRRLDPALTCYLEAARLWGGLPDRAVLAYQQAAWVLLHQEQLSDAYEPLRKAAALVREGDLRRQADQLALEAMASRLSGQTAEAARLVEDLLLPGHPGATDWHRCFALWLAADMARDEGRDELAQTFLHRAGRYIEGARDPALWNRVEGLRRTLQVG